MDNLLPVWGTTLLDLPPEILYTILRDLDLQSFLAVRQTCKALHSAANNRNLWYGFIQELEARPGHSRLEAPWTDYTAEELAQWVLRRFRVEKVWHMLSVANAPRPPCSLTLFEVDASSGNAILLPGGRWLLMLQCSEGRLHVLDLERPGSKSEVLIEGVGGNAGEIEWVWAHWIDSSAPRLSVRVALGPRLRGNPWEPREVSFQIYNVELVGHGLNAKLRAEHMTTIRYSSLGHHKTATLNDEHFLEIRQDTVLQMTVTKYCDGGQPVHSKPMTIMISHENLTVVHLVWDERIILFDETSAKVLIYSLTQMDNTGLNKVLQPLHSLSCSAVAAAALPQIEGFTFWGECHISTPIVRPEWVRFIIAEEDRIWGLNIPRDITVAPSLKSLARESSLWLGNAGMGYQHSLFLSPRSIDVVSYAWDGSEAETQGSMKTIANAFPRLKRSNVLSTGYSEELGRIVAYHCLDKTYIVVDLI